MAESVKGKFFSGIAWTFIQNIAVKGLGFVFMVILTRVLTPEDYGLIGMLSIFIAVSEVFIISGFGEALIQKKDCSDEDFTTAFYFNVTIALFIYVILFLSAPLIANFYHEPQLVILTRVLCLNFVFGSLNIVQQAKLSKAMNFKPLAIITLVSVLLSGVIGVVMACSGFGVWALVAQTISATTIRVVLFPVFTQWHPQKPFSRTSFHQLWDYGSRLLFTGVMSVVIVNISNILIGRFYNKNQVGYYNRAQSFAVLPSETLFYMLNSVAFPAFCQVQEDRERWLNMYRRILFNTVLLVCPIIIMLAILAKPLVIILFTERWIECVPLVQALLLARMFMPIGATHTALLRSAGNTTLYMKLYLITGPLSLIAVLISIPFGVVAMAWASFVGSLLSYLIPAFVIGRKFGYTLFLQLWDWRLIFVSLIMMGVGVYFSVYWIEGAWFQMIVGAAVGAIIYYSCCKMLKLLDEDMLRVLTSKFPFFRKH